MQRWTLAACLLAPCVAVDLAAATEVFVRSATPYDGDVQEGTLTASPAVIRNDEKPVSVKFTVPGRASLELADGVWRLDVKAPGWFHAGHTVVVKGDTSIAVPIWRLGSVSGKVKTSDNEPIAAMTARWSASAQVPASPPEGETSCAVTLNEYRCAVPVGVIDLKLSSKGYVSQFLWEVHVGSFGEELPLIRLTRGAGLYGWVEVGHGVQLDRKNIRVILMPERTSAKRETVLTTTVDDRGFFAFRGVAPGAYGITASATKDVGSEERRVVIRQGGETELLRPLMLERRESLRVTITPPFSPSGAPWHLEITRSEAGNVADPVARVAVDATGSTILPGLAAGSYDLWVRTERTAEAWFRRSIELPRDKEVAIEVRLIKVVGTVRMKNDPVPTATLWLGGKHKGPRVTLTTDADGAFSGIAPFDPDTPWEVAIFAKQPDIEATVRQRPIRESETTVRLDLTVPAARISGVVLEASGKPAARATVNVLNNDGSADVKQVQVRAEDGGFELIGLTPGDYTIDAEGTEGRRSATSVVSVGEDNVTSVRLTLADGLRMRGRVISEDGTGVSGAQVYAISVEAPPPFWLPTRTSTTGEFEILLPDQTRNVNVFVIAPGFSFRAFRPPLQTDQQLMILMRQNGGALDLVTPSWDSSNARVPYLIHNGTALPLMFLASARLVSVTKHDADSLRTAAPLFEPGGYGLCFATPAEIASAEFQTEHCSFGHLAPFGSLALTVADSAVVRTTP